jgi:hypothetical protein
MAIMLRTFSMFSLGAVFLAISPHLRQQVFGAIGSGVSAMDFYAPYSYVAGGILVLVTMVISFYRGAQAR